MLHCNIRDAPVLSSQLSAESMLLAAASQASKLASSVYKRQHVFDLMPSLGLESGQLFAGSDWVGLTMCGLKRLEMTLFWV